MLCYMSYKCPIFELEPNIKTTYICVYFSSANFSDHMNITKF